MNLIIHNNKAVNVSMEQSEPVIKIGAPGYISISVAHPTVDLNQVRNNAVVFKFSQEANELQQQVTNNATRINELQNRVDAVTDDIINLDVIAPRETPYTKDEAVSYVANVVQPGNKKNAVIVFNDGNEACFYSFSSRDVLNFSNPNYWKRIEGSTDAKIIYYNSYTAFPSIGIEDTTYIDKSTGRFFYWSKDSLTYRRLGLDKEDLQIINANF